MQNKPLETTGMIISSSHAKNATKMAFRQYGSIHKAIGTMLDELSDLNAARAN